MGTVSAVALTLLILVFLRSVRAVFQILATLAVSFTAAFAVVWLTFGGIHVITLVFGMTLLGIAADYVFHYRAELLAEPDPKAARDKLARGLHRFARNLGCRGTARCSWFRCQASGKWRFSASRALCAPGSRFFWCCRSYPRPGECLRWRRASLNVWRALRVPDKSAG